MKLRRSKFKWANIGRNVQHGNTHFAEYDVVTFSRRGKFSLTMRGLDTLDRKLRWIYSKQKYHSLLQERIQKAIDDTVTEATAEAEVNKAAFFKRLEDKRRNP